MTRRLGTVTRMARSSPRKKKRRSGARIKLLPAVPCCALLCLLCPAACCVLRAACCLLPAACCLLPGSASERLPRCVYSCVHYSQRY